MDRTGGFAAIVICRGPLAPASGTDKRCNSRYRKEQTKRIGKIVWFNSAFDSLRQVDANT